jgi:hypothetical protein
MSSARTLRTLVVAFGVALLGLLSVVPTQAAESGPVVFDAQLTRHGVFENCGTFNVTFIAHINAHFEQFFSDSGQLVLERRHVQFTGTLTNATSAASVPYEGNFIRTLDVLANTLTLEGLINMTALPDEGVVAMAAGRNEVNATTFALISESGQTMSSYRAAICQILA